MAEPVRDRRRVPAAAPAGPRARAVVELEPDSGAWLGFVTRNPSATPFHHPRWLRAIAACYGYRPAILAQVERARVVAGLPAVVLPGRFGPSRAIALPFTDHCPPLAAGDEGAELRTGLVAWSARKVTPLEVHADLGPAPGVTRALAGVRHALRLRPVADELLPLFDRNVRQRLRKLERGPLEADADCSADALEAFYELHVKTRRRLGVPVQPRRFFELLWRDVLRQDLGYCVVAHTGGRPVAAAVFLAWNRTVVYKYSASDPEYWRLAPNHLVLWTAIRRACGEDRTLLDLGRTDLENAGLRTFKSEWGAREARLFHSGIGRSPSHGPSPAARRLLAAAIRSGPPSLCRVTGELLYGRFP